MKPEKKLRVYGVGFRPPTKLSASLVVRLAL